MSCTSCRTFAGPICGACRAAQRIQGLLQSGRVPISEERRITGLLRGVAGELSDIVESSTPGSGSQEATAHQQGGTHAHTPGAEERKSVKKEPSPESYSEELEEEEEEEFIKDQEVKPGPSQVDKGVAEKSPRQEVAEEPPRKDHRAREVRAPNSRSAGVIVHPAAYKEDPHYLSRALQLRPCVKASARSERRDSNRSRERTPREKDWNREEDRGRAPKAASGVEVEGEFRRHDGDRHEEEPYRNRRPDGTPDRSPIVRRPRDPREVRKQNPKKKKTNKGQKRRDRGRDFRARQGKRQQRHHRW